jgi:hypothetical protein
MNRESTLVVVLGIAAISVVIAEIALASSPLSQLESALFGVLQFVFSLGFAWYLSKESSQTEFEKRQRKFAISAFRRIKEIEGQTNYLLQRLNEAQKGPQSDHLHNHSCFTATDSVDARLHVVVQRADWHTAQHAQRMIVCVEQTLVRFLAIRA